MSNWKDTVMSMEEMTRANEEAHLSPFANPYQEKCVIARTQAEISFRAGIREAVEWIRKECYHKKSPPSPNTFYLVPPWKLEAKLKEWGVDKPQ